MRSVFSRRFDWALLALVMLLCAFGVLMIASALAGNEMYANWYLRQIGFLAVGLILLVLAAVVDYRLLASLAYPIYLIFLAMLVVIVVAGTVAGGARRWLEVGQFFLQPSELSKIALILALAHYLSGREEKMESILTPLGAIVIMLPAVILIYLQPNLGTALSVLAIGGMMLLVSGLRWRHMIVIGGLAVGVAIPVWRFVLQDYMKQRILVFLNPSQVSVAERYNVEQAIIGIGSGGWLGRGLFRGAQSQLHFLRVRHSDFIFSVVAEELGFIGAALLIVLFVLLLLRLVYIAARARDTFGMLIVTGVTTMILFQVVVNIGMNLNIMPVTGIPLPFISYGGSSLWAMLIGIGLVESVQLRHKKIGFDA
ncbi:MAG: rod shape-determining protein RodA [Anaerolineae bacterium]